MTQRCSLAKNDNKVVFVYTLVDEDGIGIILKGYHRFNRVGYLFAKTEVEIPECGIRYW